MTKAPFTIFFADLTHMGFGINANMFPLGIGMVAAYAKSRYPDMRLRLFKFPDELNAALEHEMPDILCLSNYAWNANLTYLFAKAVKARNPKTITVAGGPNFPLTPEGREQFLRDRSAYDYYIKWDGELAFAALLAVLVRESFDLAKAKAEKHIVENCCYLTPTEYVEGPDARVEDLEQLPSPYLSGLFDSFFEHPLVPLMETSRGCPYACTFCNDGDVVRNRVYKRPHEDVRAEINYIAERKPKTKQLMIADLNFGMYREDVLTAECIRDSIFATGWPTRIEASMGKSQPKRVMNVVNIINSAEPGVLKFGASLQSTDKSILTNIKRKNIPLEVLRFLSDEKNQEGGEDTERLTELILGLPGDSPRTHEHSLRYVIDDLGMNNIDIHQLTMLMGSRMAEKADRERFNLVARHRIYVGCLGRYRLLGQEVNCAETEEIVIEGSEMTTEEYLDCRVLNLLVKIYIDHEPFEPVFGYVASLGLSRFDLLLFLKNEVLEEYSPLKKLFADFRRDNMRWLFNKVDSALDFISKDSNLDGYISGELGKNELLFYRARAVIDYADEIHDVLERAAVGYLDRNNMLTEHRRDFLKETVRFCQLRNFNPGTIDSNTYGIFTYDFVQATERRYAVDPEEVRTKPQRIRFHFSDDSRAIVKDLQRTWSAQSGGGWAKILQKSNLKRIERRVELMGPERRRLGR